MIVVPVAIGLLVLLVVRLRDMRLAGLPDAIGAPMAFAPTRVVVSPSRARAVAALAVTESRRLLTHPVLLVGGLLSVLVMGVSTSGDDPFTRYIELTGSGGTALYVPLLAFVAAGLCASRTRRARAGEVLDATAATPFERTLAQCLAAIGPALASFVLILAALGLFVVADAELPRTPPVWELLTMPLAILGAGTLGVMVSRWLPFRGAPLLVVAALVTVSIALSEDYPLLITFVEYAEWGENDTYVALQSLPSAAHGLYIIGLDVMAAIGALLVHRDHRRPLLALGAVATAGTIVAALAAT